MINLASCNPAREGREGVVFRTKFFAHLTKVCYADSLHVSSNCSLYKLLKFSSIMDV